MTLTFSVKTDIDVAALTLADRFQNQVPFATALALTRTAQDAQRVVVKQLPSIFDRPTPFTLSSIGTQAALKSDLTSSVFIKPVAAQYLKFQLSGGIRYPLTEGATLPLATDYPLDQYGNIPRNTLRRLLARPDCFLGTIRGTKGIWQRQGRELVLLIDLVGRFTYRAPRFHFADIVQQVITDRILPNFADAMEQAVATAR